MHDSQGVDGLRITTANVVLLLHQQEHTVVSEHMHQLGNMPGAED
jgi:hypothetical protein